MKQEQFELQHAADWAAFDSWLAQRGQRRKKDAPPPPFPAHEAPQRYRRICQQLALARDRGYSAATVDHLHRLAQLGHDVLYGARRGFWREILAYATGGFAADVRAQRRWVLASALLFFGPLLATYLAVQAWPEFAYLILDPSQVRDMEAMYGDDTQRLGRLARDAEDDFQMFGYYIYNNISIAFRCFAGGITAGLFTVLALVFNGLYIGAVHARVVLAGHGDAFHSFVAGHGALELGAIVLAGAAGLRLGAALLAPGRQTRADALRETGRSLIGMVCGFAVMLFAAALVEAFWSPLRLPLPVKLGVGGTLAALTLAYFIFAGRGRAA